MMKLVCAFALLVCAVLASAGDAQAWGVREAMVRCHGHHACGLGAASCPSNMQMGFVTIYGNNDGVRRGSKTSSGEGFEPTAMKAASKLAPRGSSVSVYNPMTGTTTAVTINDYGPALAALDVTPAVAKTLGMGGSSKYMCLGGPGYGGTMLASARQSGHAERHAEKHAKTKVIRTANATPSYPVEDKAKGR